MANSEGLVLNGTDLNDGTNYSLRSVDFTPPKKRQEWVQGADADGAALVRDPLFENRTITIRLRVPTQSTVDIALGTKVGALVDLLEEAEKQADGIPLVWTPANGTKSITFYVLSGEVTALPIEKNAQTSGYFLKAPTVELRLDCKPFGYGALVSSAATVTNTDPVQLLTLASVTGDVPAEGRLVVTDAATQNRRHVEWGLQQRYYDAATSLLIDTASLVTAGFAGTSHVFAGGYSGDSIFSQLFSRPIAICGTGNLAHVGTYRVKARVYGSNTTAANFFIRLTWRDGDGPLRSNDYVKPAVASAWTEVDLGTITIPEKALGTQRWTGQIEAYTTGATGTPQLDVDYLVLIPTEGYGKARALYSYTPGAITAHDEFTAMVNTTVLNGRVAPVGGTWATSGVATDFACTTATGNSAPAVSRSTAASEATPRIAVLGSTNYTDTEVGADVMFSAVNPSATVRLIARYVDASNYLFLLIPAPTASGLVTPVVYKRVAGAETDIYDGPSVSVTTNTWYRFVLTVATSGRGQAIGSIAGGATLFSGTFADSVLTTGATLASGLPGIGDQNGNAVAITRYFDNVYHSTPRPESMVAYSGRAAEIRYDSAIRQDSTGTYYGPIDSYRGSRFLLPPAGSAARTSRILVKARRNDVDALPDDQIADSTTATVHYTPRYLVVPR